jgi:hypothetical protein
MTEPDLTHDDLDTLEMVARARTDGEVAFGQVDALGLIELARRGLPKPPCHLPLCALKGDAFCPQCRNPASDHRNWKEPQR